ncbi:hypothetical protein O1611_g427 [Lasiodiplodia mahajangana]|uniref:Uncharacterized protein n=1 Tax=Lasiodiplodia mahajangana TaxID=1108764 RepID=A0ACC2K0W3_9PEZI|nr:hypothetical protein O1611_g427 [Lasiodiplodia mahajangana]
MAMNRRHALTTSVGKFSGIQIDMSLLRDIDIQPDKKTAWFQGGAYDGQVIDYLWDRGLVATTGSCTCVGMMGPGLGGGHGRYQGLYGLISDNLVNLNVVLADGTAIRINQSSHPDLWWAMQGAGHNFGIVTSFELKLHPRQLNTWYYRNYVFLDAQIDSVFEEVNKLYKNGTGAPGELGSVGVYSMNPQYSKDKATLTWSFIYAGSAKDAAPYLAPFEKIQNVARIEGNVPYTQVAAIQGTDDDSENCQKNRTHITTTVNLQVFNVTAQRQIYDLFNQNIKKHPELSSAVATMELYSVDAVTKVPRQRSSYSQRDEFILNFFDVPFTQESSLEGFAEEWAKETRNLWNAGQPGRRPTTYLNYAFGDESLESIYGYDGQLERLRALKHKYDPANRFRPPVTAGRRAPMHMPFRGKPEECTSTHSLGAYGLRKRYLRLATDGNAVLPPTLSSFSPKIIRHCVYAVPKGEEEEEGNRKKEKEKEANLVHAKIRKLLKKMYEHENRTILAVGSGWQVLQLPQIGGSTITSTVHDGAKVVVVEGNGDDAVVILSTAKPQQARSSKLARIPLTVQGEVERQDDVSRGSLAYDEVMRREKESGTNEGFQGRQRDYFVLATHGANRIE